MKLKYLVFLVLLLLASEGYTQVKPFRFGVKAAPNLAWMAPDSKDYDNEGAQPGFSWGFLADITLTDNYFVKTGFSVDYLNGKLSYPHQEILDEVAGTYTQGSLFRKYNLRYLEIPVTLKMRTNQFGNTAFFGEIGFGTSFNLKARAKDEFVPNDGTPPLESENNIKDDIKLVKGSLIVGAGIEYFLNESNSLVGSVTYNNGLTNILNGNNAVDTEEKQRAIINYFQLNVGILF